MKKIIFILLLASLQIQTYAQNKKVLDSLMRVYNTAKHDTTKILALKDIAYEYRNNKPDTSIALSENALQMSEKIGFEKGKGWAKNRMARGKLTKKDFSSAMDLLTQAQIHFEKANDLKGLASNYNTIGYSYEQQSKMTLAIEKYNKSIFIREQIKDKKGIANNLNSIGLIYYNQNNYPLALDYHQKSLKIQQEIGDKQGIAYSLNSTGLIYQNQGNYPLALEYQQKSLKIREAINDKRGIAASLGNLGIIYTMQSNFSLGLDYFEKSLKIQQEVGDKQGIAECLSNMGVIYDNLRNYPLALDYHQKSLKIREEIGDKSGVNLSLGNIGIIYENQGDYDMALEYYQKSLKISEEIGDRRIKIYCLNGLAQITQKQGHYAKSIDYAQQGLQIAQSTKSPVEMNLLSKTLYQTYKLKGDYVKALEYHELYKTMNDSLFNIDRTKKIANLEAKVEIEKKEKEIEILNKNQEISQKNAEVFKKDAELQRIEVERQKNAKLALQKEAEAKELLYLASQEKDKRKADSLRSLAQSKQFEVEKHLAQEQKLKAESKSRELEVLKEKEAKEFQQKINYLVILGLLFVVGFAFFIFRSRQKEIKAKEAIAEQKEEIFQMNEELNITLTTLNEQKNEIEEKNQAIEDSIAYAKRIQQVILPLEATIKIHIPEHFIFFQPRDVVSGDFYYFEEKNDKLVLAAIDCTGHGVPGAFMTMIASEILNEIIQNKGILESDLILNELHKRVRIALKQEETTNRDGMDLVLLVIDKAQKVVQFAGAKNPLIYIQNNELHQIKGDKMPIGGEQREAERIFTKHLIDINTPTTFYLFSDGYQDQFGGKEKKKFMIAQMKTLFLEVHQKPLDLQKEILEKNINTWITTGTEKQVDDILVLGLRL